MRRDNFAYFSIKKLCFRCSLEWPLSDASEHIYNIGFYGEQIKYEPRCEKTGLQGFPQGPTRLDTNQAVQPQKMTRGLKFCI